MKAIIGAVMVLLLSACNMGKVEERLRAEGRSKLNDTCIANAAVAPLGKLLDAEQYRTFCGCFADRGIAIISKDELQAMALGNMPEGITARVTEQAKDCARPMIDADFKGILKNQCIKMAEQQGRSDQTARDFCACSATKSLELLGPEGRKRIIDALDVGSQDMATVKQAASFCMQSMQPPQ